MASSNRIKPGQRTQLEKNLCDNIRKIVRERGISGKEIADYMYVSDNYLSEIITYRKIPSYERIEILAKYFKVEPFELFKKCQLSDEDKYEYKKRGT